MDASGVGFCGFGGDGVFRGAMVAGLCKEQDVQPLWMVSDWVGVGLVVGKIELIGAGWAKASELVGFFESGKIRHWSRKTVEWHAQQRMDYGCLFREK